MPYLMLQPLVENAVKHGVAKRARSGTIRIGATREAGRVTLTVRDDGRGLAAAGAPAAGDGIGLANVRARLRVVMCLKLPCAITQRRR